MRVIPYILYLFLIAGYRVLLAEPFTIGMAQIYFSALIVLLVALFKPFEEALWFAFVAGLVFDAPDPSRLGVHVLIFSVLAVATSQMKVHLNLESMKSQMLVIICGLLVYSIPHTLIYLTSGASAFLILLVKAAIPGTIYTAVFGWLFFMFQSGRLSYARIRSIF